MIRSVSIIGAIVNFFLLVTVITSTTLFQSYDRGASKIRARMCYTNHLIQYVSRQVYSNLSKGG